MKMKNNIAILTTLKKPHVILLLRHEHFQKQAAVTQTSQRSKLNQYKIQFKHTE